MTTFQVITPEEYKISSTKFQIFYGYHSTPFGKCLIATTEEGICHLSFVDNSEAAALDLLEQQWSKTQLLENTCKTTKVVEGIFSENNTFLKHPLRLLLKGTDFQIKVWQALTSIPRGTTTSYENIAQAIDKPRAVRAAANAIANNPIAYVIPCHRVIHKSGSINKYRWGIERKRNILLYESEQHNSSKINIK